MNASSCSTEKRRWPPGVRYPRRWPRSDQRRIVLSETPRWRAASEVERPRRRPTGAPEPWLVGGVMTSLTAVWSGFDRIGAALQRFGAENHPAARREARAERRQARGHQRVQAPPHAFEAPVEVQRQERDRDEDAERRDDHRAGEVARVARADEDPVEGEDDRARRLHQREQRPEHLGLVDDALVAAEQ